MSCSGDGAGPLAQLVEQRTFNPRVVGSIPTGPTRSDQSQYAAAPKLIASGLRCFHEISNEHRIRDGPLGVDRAGFNTAVVAELTHHVP